MRTRHPIVLTVVGGGAFGSILAQMSATSGHSVRLWLRDKSLAEEMRKTRINRKYMPRLRLNDSLHIATDLRAALSEAELIILAIPSKAFRQVFMEVLPKLASHQYLVSTTKGLEPKHFRTMSQIMMAVMEERGLNAQQRIGVLSGPNLASELMNKHITGTVIGARNPQLRQLVRRALGTKYFHIFDSEDVYGVELGGVLKNVYAIAAGIADSLGFGMNTKSVLITRALMEMTHFSQRLGINPNTFLGLAGIGDLIVTCSSVHSRNYRLGQALLSGQSITAINEQLGGVAEGAHTTELVYKKAQELAVAMPLLTAIYEIVCLSRPVKYVLWQTLRYTPKEDIEYLS